MPIRTRREMAERLQEVMSHAYTELEDRQRLEAGTRLLKTYLLEAQSDNPAHQDVLRILTTAFSPEMLGENSRSRVHDAFWCTSSFNSGVRSSGSGPEAESAG